MSKLSKEQKKIQNAKHQHQRILDAKAGKLKCICSRVSVDWSCGAPVCQRCKDMEKKAKLKEKEPAQT